MTKDFALQSRDLSNVYQADARFSEAEMAKPTGEMKEDALRLGFDRRPMLHLAKNARLEETSARMGSHPASPGLNVAFHDDVGNFLAKLTALGRDDIAELMTGWRTFTRA
jgi:hypothetical protein